MRLGITAAAALAAVMIAFAQSARAQSGMDPCTAKVMAECQSGGGDVGVCMHAHMSELMACRNGGAPGAMPVRAVRGLRAVCGKEIHRYCRHAEGDAALQACLKEHGPKLGDSCRGEALSAAHAAHKALNDDMASLEKACRKDGERFCPGKTFRTGEGPCLKAHRSRISSGCSDAVMRAQASMQGESARFGGGN